MRDVDALIRALDGPPTTRPAPRWPRSRAPWALLAIAAAAALAWTQVPEARFRGAPGAPRVDLRMVVDRGEGAMRVSAGGTYHVGDRVFFRVAASPGARVNVWVEGPGGREVVGAVDASGTPVDVRVGEGLVAYEFDGPGRYTFVAGADADTACVGCGTVALEVR